MADDQQQLFLGAQHGVDATGHGVEGLGQIPKFIGSLLRNPVGQVAAADFRGPFLEPAQPA